jgi:hypothetical protein
MPDVRLRWNALRFSTLRLLVFIEFVPRPRYWKIVAHHEGGTRVEVNYDPSEQERQWQAQFLGVDVSE